MEPRRRALHLGWCARVPPAQSKPTENQQQPQPRYASGARDTPALHRMTERVSSIAVKAKPCGRCAAWTEPGARHATCL